MSDNMNYRIKDVCDWDAAHIFLLLEETRALRAGSILYRDGRDLVLESVGMPPGMLFGLIRKYMVEVTAEC